MSHPEEVARNHPAYQDFVLHCEENIPVIHPEQHDFQQWDREWKCFLAGYNACLRMNGLVE